MHAHRCSTATAIQVFFVCTVFSRNSLDSYEYPSLVSMIVLFITFVFMFMGGGVSQPPLDLSSVVHMINAAEPIDAASIDAFEVRYKRSSAASLAHVHMTYRVHAQAHTWKNIICAHILFQYEEYS